MAKGNMHRKFPEVWQFLRYAPGQTDPQTLKQADYTTCTCLKGEVKTIKN